MVKLPVQGGGGSWGWGLPSPFARFPSFLCLINTKLAFPRRLSWCVKWHRVRKNDLETRAHEQKLPAKVWRSFGCRGGSCGRSLTSPPRPAVCGWAERARAGAASWPSGSCSAAGGRSGLWRAAAPRCASGGARRSSAPPPRCPPRGGAGRGGTAAPPPPVTRRRGGGAVCPRRGGRRRGAGGAGAASCSERKQSVSLETAALSRLSSPETEFLNPGNPSKQRWVWRRTLTWTGCVRASCSCGRGRGGARGSGPEKFRRRRMKAAFIPTPVTSERSPRSGLEPGQLRRGGASGGGSVGPKVWVMKKNRNREDDVLET